MKFRLSEITEVQHGIAAHDPPELLVRSPNRVGVPLQPPIRVPLDDGSMNGYALLVLYLRGQVKFLRLWLYGLPPDIERLAELQRFGTE